MALVKGFFGSLERPLAINWLLWSAAEIERNLWTLGTLNVERRWLLRKVRLQVSVTFTESEIRSFNKYIANSSDFLSF